MKKNKARAAAKLAKRRLRDDAHGTNKGSFVMARIKQENPDFNNAYQAGLRNGNKLGYKFDFIFAVFIDEVSVCNAYVTADLSQAMNQSSPFFVVCQPGFECVVNSIYPQIKSGLISLLPSILNA